MMGLSPYSSGLRTGRAARSLRRGATLLVTVLLSAVAASIAVVVITQALNTSRAESQRGSADAATVAVDETRRALETALTEDSHFFLKETFVSELPRVCPTDSSVVVGPDKPWPATCGSSWTYAPTEEEGARQVMLTAPTPDSPVLTARILAREGDATAGTLVSYRLSGAGRYTVWTEENLLLDDLGRGETTTTLSGSLYTGSTMYLPASDRVQLQNAQLLAETGFAGTPDGAALRYYTQGENLDLPLRPIRDVTPSVLSSSGLAAGAQDLADLACRTPSRFLESGYVTSLCLRSGEVLTQDDGTEVTVPAGAVFYLLVPGQDNTPGKVDVYYATTAPSYSGDCVIACDLARLSAPEVAAGVHPGTAEYWTSLGRFSLPVSGVVSTDADVQVGLCGEAFLAPGTECAALSGSEPGAEIQRSLTVLAGTPEQPRDLYVGSSLHQAGAARLGLVATGDVVFPYWARAGNTTMDVDAAVVGLGLGNQNVTSPVSAIRTLPLQAGPGSPEGNPNYAEKLHLTGSLAAPALDLRLGLFRSVELSSDAGLLSAPPPYFPSFSNNWEISDQRRMNLEEISEFVAPE